MKPLQSLAQRPRIWMRVGIAWIMAFIFATPQLFIFLQVHCDDDDNDDDDDSDGGDDGYDDDDDDDIQRVLMPGLGKVLHK